MARIRRQAAVVAATGVFLLSGLSVPAALAAPRATPAPPAVTNDSAPPPPTDVDPNVPGVQVEIPYYTEPEFLLQAGIQRWDVRNRPAGTVAAGYGHTDDAIHDDLTATARYAPLGAATSYYGVIGANRQPLDVTTAIPGELRTYTWLVTRYDDGSVEFQGPMEKGMPARYVFGIGFPDSPSGYVGGTVVSDAPGALSLVLVRPTGTLAMAQLGGGGWQLSTIDTAGGPAVAAISRSVSAFDKAPRDGVSIADEAPNTSTLLVVWRQDGQFVPFRIGVGANGITKLNLLSSQNVNLNAAPAYAPSTFDFDFDCVAARLNTPNFILFWTGPVAMYLGCPEGHDGGASVDTISLGRISIGVPVKPITGPEVRVLTAGDFAHAASDGTAFYPASETRVETGCAYASSQPATGVVPVGSFDVRTVLGVTHLACVEPSGFKVNISEYMQPTNAMALQLNSDPLGREAEKAQIARSVKRTAFDHTYEPPRGGSGNGEVPLPRTVYDTITQPTIQIQFPCAHLLARPVRSGQLLNDCDTSMPILVPPNVQIAPPPPNWISYTVAAYATVTVHNHPLPRLVVTTVPGALPLDRTYTNTATPSPFGEYGNGGVDNFSWTVQPSPYLASDLTSVLSNASDPTSPPVDVSTFDIYRVPAQNGPRLLLSQVVRPARTTVELDLGSSGPSLTPSATVPIAVMQAAPLAGGMGQNDNYQATFGHNGSHGSGTTRGGSTTLGAHVGVEATAVVGVGAGGNNVRAGGGVSAEFQFSNEVEESLERSVVDSVGDAYNAAPSDHHIVTRYVNEWVWHGIIIKDPTGLAAGQPATYSVPAADGAHETIWPLSQLAQDQPGLYGPHGLYGKSLERILAGSSPGDPGSYLHGVDDPGGSPPSILAENGGPCKGGFVGPNIKTPFTGDLPKVIDPTNPFYDAPPEDPKGSNILLSNSKPVAVSDGSGLESDIAIDSETTRSLVASLSYDFSLTAIGKITAEEDAGLSSEAEVVLTAGVDAGWGTSAGVSDTLGESTELTATIGGLPYLGSAWYGANKAWVDKETYMWQMFLCKAQLGPIGLGHEVWVQGFLTDGYHGVGGLDDLAPIDLTAPEDAALVRAAATPGPASGNATTCGSGLNEFSWSQAEGTLKSESVTFKDTVTGAKRSRFVQSWTDPQDFIDHIQRNADDDRLDVVPRPSCAGVDPGAFVDGEYYEASVVATGFLPDESLSSDPITVHAEVWPPQQTISLQPAPIVGQDGSVKVQIEDPGGVHSLKHHVKIVNVRSPGVVVEEKDGVGDSYTTLPLVPGTYEATVYGYNDWTQPGGGRAKTPLETVQFTYAPNQLAAQWNYECGHTSCTVDDTMQFTDESTVANATIETWLWTFGDGSTSSAANPTHRFTAPSTATGYPVKLKVVDSLGHSDTLTQNVLVGPSRLPGLSVADVKVNEKNAPAKASFRLQLSKPGDQSVKVTFSTADGTAIAGKDYTAVTGSVTFAPGETVKTVKVPYLQDTKAEPTETFKLKLKASPTLVNVVDGTGVCRIVDDD